MVLGTHWIVLEVELFYIKYFLFNYEISTSRRHMTGLVIDTLELVTQITHACSQIKNKMR